MNVPPHHPLQELLGCLLLGIETVPHREQGKMVNRACREAVKWHEERIKSLLAAAKEMDLLVTDIIKSTRGNLIVQNYQRLNEAPIANRNAIEACNK